MRNIYPETTLFSLQHPWSGLASDQELEHQNGLLSSDLQAASNSWFTKTFAQRRVSSGGLPVLGLSRDDAPLAGWRAKRMAWLPKESTGQV